MQGANRDACQGVASMGQEASAVLRLLVRMMSQGA